MNRVIGEKKAYWIGGTLTGLLGVALVRLVAPELDGMAAAICAPAGYFLVIAGITVLGLATRKDRSDAFLSAGRETGR
jgi:hypothetical protein